MRTIKFRACAGFPKYEVDEVGSVWSLDYNHTGKRKELKQYLDEDGYPYVFFVVNRKRYKRAVHRLVAQSLLPPKPTPKHQVNHKNGVRDDNRLPNLEWMTSKENTLHGWRVNGRKVTQKMRAASSRNAKLLNEKRWHAK